MFLNRNYTKQLQNKKQRELDLKNREIQEHQDSINNAQPQLCQASLDIFENKARQPTFE